MIPGYSYSPLRNPYSDPLLTLAAMHSKAVLLGDTESAIYLEGRWKLWKEKEIFWELSKNQMALLTYEALRKVRRG